MQNWKIKSASSSAASEKMSQLTDYYRGEARDTEGRTLQQAWDMYDDWETCHDFIQWLFPLPEPSDFNPDAPLLTEDDIKIFKADPGIRNNLLYSSRLMLKFFGMKLRSGAEDCGIDPDAAKVMVGFDEENAKPCEIVGEPAAVVASGVRIHCVRRNRERILWPL